MTSTRIGEYTFSSPENAAGGQRRDNCDIITEMVYLVVFFFWFSIDLAKRILVTFITAYLSMLFYVRYIWANLRRNVIYLYCKILIFINFSLLTSPVIRWICGAKTKERNQSAIHLMTSYPERKLGQYEN